MIDVVVVGAGPVGLATAMAAAGEGLSVTVVESRGTPIDKACGEGLMPEAVARLARLGVDPPGVPFAGIRYCAGEAVAEARFSGDPGRGVRRTDLHASMTQRAHDVGVRFVTGHVESIAQDATGVDVLGLRSRYLVGADGLHSRVRRHLGVGAHARGPQRFGVRQHFSVAPWSDLVEVHWLPDAEVYVTPVAENTVGVAVLGVAPLDLPSAVTRSPALRARLDGAPPASTVRGAGPLRQRVTARTVGRVLLVGDAAGYVDALTGEGLRVGFAEAEAVVRAVMADDPSVYEHEWHRITRSYRWLTNGLLWTASRRTLRPLIVPSARAMPAIFGRLVNSLGA